jgi:hypothetical protein
MASNRASIPFLAALEAKIENLFRRSCGAKANGGSAAKYNSRQSNGGATAFGG